MSRRGTGRPGRGGAPGAEAAGVLTLVPTPIGNPMDFPPRAVDALRAAGIVAAEDTRVALPFLRQIGVETVPVSYHDHNERTRAPWLVGQLLAGRDVALITDAGTPLVSDPGYRLVTAAAEAGVRVVALPGPCAAVVALTASGLPPDRFTFAGFLPRVAGRRDAVIRELGPRPETLVFYESPHRALESLDALLAGLGDRPAALGWNLTKGNERVIRGPLSAIRAELASWEYVHGEMTLVVAGARGGEDAAGWERADRLIAALLDAGLEPRTVRDVVAGTLDLDRKEVYRRVNVKSNSTG